MLKHPNERFFASNLNTTPKDKVLKLHTTCGRRSLGRWHAPRAAEFLVSVAEGAGSSGVRANGRAEQPMSRHWYRIDRAERQLRRRRAQEELVLAHRRANCSSHCRRL